jgi:hypothetical protein
MKVLAYVEVSGDFGDNLTEDDVDEILDALADSAGESTCTTVRINVREYIEIG